MEVKLILKINDANYQVIIPPGYSEVSRLTWKGNSPGVNATNKHGKIRFFRASRVYAKTS